MMKLLSPSAVYSKFLIGFLFVVTSANAEDKPFQAMLACHASADNPGLAVWLEQSGELVFSGALGVANVRTGDPLSVDDVFQIGSMTKQFTAAAILQLAEEGDLSLSSKLGDFIPDLPSGYSVLTIESVLNHTAGLPNYNTNSSIRRQWRRFKPIDEIIAAITKMPLLTEPGEAYSYSNTGYVLLGKVIEVASGLTYSDYLQQHIFAPLGMKHSFMITEGESTDQLVEGYSRAPRNPDSNRSPEVVDRSWIYAAGAIASTLKDMSRWHQGLNSGNVVSLENYQRMITKARLNNGETINYGFGFDVHPISDQPSYSHQGQVPGFMSWSVYFPEKDLFATIFGNKDSVHPGPALLNIIARHLQLSPAPISSERAAEHTEALIGEYQGADDSVITVTFENGQLQAQSGGGDRRTIVLRENNSFSYECTEDYFELRERHGEKHLVPVSIYSGEGAHLVRLEDSQ